MTLAFPSMVHGLRKPWDHVQAEPRVLKGDFPSSPRAPVSPLFPTEPEPYSLLSRQTAPLPKGITCAVREGDVLLRNRACAGQGGHSQNSVICKSHYQLLAVAVPGSSWPQPSGDVGQLRPPAGSWGWRCWGHLVSPLPALGQPPAVPAAR